MLAEPTCKDICPRVQLCHAEKHTTQLYAMCTVLLHICSLRICCGSCLVLAGSESKPLCHNSVSLTNLATNCAVLPGAMLVCSLPCPSCYCPSDLQWTASSASASPRGWCGVLLGRQHCNTSTQLCWTCWTPTATTASCQCCRAAPWLSSSGRGMTRLPRHPLCTIHNRPAC